LYEDYQLVIILIDDQVAYVMPGQEFSYDLSVYKEVRVLDNKETIFRFHTQAFQDIIEKYIRNHPGQWFWAHKRWGRPKGAVVFGYYPTKSR